MEKSNRLKRFISLVVVVISISVVYRWLSAGDPPQEISKKEDDLKVNENLQADKQNGEPEDLSAIATANHQDAVINYSVLKEIREQSKGKYAYEATLEAFDAFPQKEVIAGWVAMGVEMRSDPEYAREYKALLRQLNESPQESFNAIDSTYNKISTEHAFVRGELISLVHLLKIDSSAKVSFFGSRFSDKITFDKDGEWDANSANITNAIIYMSQYQPQIGDLQLHVKNAINVNKNDPQAMKELVPRILHQFPEMSKLIESETK